MNQLVFIDPIQLQQQESQAAKRIIQALCNPAGGYKLKSPQEIVAITKLGSRLWGNFTANSDFDCLVIHACETNKSVRHVGATIAGGEKIDVRLESVESFVEQMKAGSIRCWLAFLLILSEIRVGDKKRSKNENDDAGEAETGEEEEEDRSSQKLFFDSIFNFARSPFRVCVQSHGLGQVFGF